MQRSLIILIDLTQFQSISNGRLEDLFLAGNWHLVATIMSENGVLLKEHLQLLCLISCLNLLFLTGSHQQSFETFSDFITVQQNDE